jgi:hypothetical protein
VDAVLIGEVAVYAERQIFQIIEQVFWRADGELVENRPELRVIPAANEQSDCISLRRSSRGMQPVRA